MTARHTFAGTGAASRANVAGVASYLAAWLVAAAFVLVLPLVLTSNFHISLMSQMGIAVVFALSYNMLLGQGGMLSFGHAVLFGLGAFCAIHGIRWLMDGLWALPLELIPLAGGVAGLFFGILIGAVATRRAATAFAMITLGLGELIATSAIMFKGFFGGESGVTADRMVDQRLLPFTYGPSIHVYYLIAAWMFLATLLMYLQTRTPLGRMANAVRDNPLRAQFVGYDPYMVRFFQFALSGFFAGIAGGLFAINHELVNFEAVAAGQSGLVLLMTFIGGVGHFFGPVLGAILVTLLQSTLSLVTGAWMLYFGILFVLMVMFAPGGIAGLIAMHAPAVRAGRLHTLAVPYLRALVPALMVFAGFVLFVEVNYHLSAHGGRGPVRVWWMGWEAGSPLTWIAVAVLVLGGGWWLRREARGVRAAWGEVDGYIKSGGGQ
ncbi:MAG TPA: branched-chain amino acid ABC transporter permease [Azospirillaceae bacterium]|nr:branched-chain amino acid ABC transporter permease [Azospirillaceae bacterium]